MPRPRRKRQARLTFSPVPSWAAGASSCPGQIRERAAAVRYDNHGRPAKKRRLDGIPSGQARDAVSSSPVIHINPKVIVESPSKKASIPKQSSIFSGAAIPTPAPSSQSEGMGKLGTSSTQQEAHSLICIVAENNRLYRVVHSSSDEDRSSPQRGSFRHCGVLFRRDHREVFPILAKPTTKTGIKGHFGIETSKNLNKEYGM